jgi:triacylglycerol lipase
MSARPWVRTKMHGSARGAEARGWSAAGFNLPVLGALLVAVTSLFVAGTTQATESFDPTTPEAEWDGASPLLEGLDGQVLWSRIERFTDGDSVLFGQEDFAPGTEWVDDAQLAPHSAQLFGDPTPHSGTFLLHFAQGWASATRPTPTLLVTGASSSASGTLALLAAHLAGEGRAVFALTFAHPHGDCFAQAEQVANAVERIIELTGAEQVDLVGHSKGGIAAAVYLSHTATTTWANSADSRGDRYATRGTPYRGDVRRFVAVGVPLGGLDTSFRWPSNHLVPAAGNDPLVPSAWQQYYPYGTANLLVYDELTDIDLWPEDGDPYPGQAQLLRAWDDEHALPGSRVELGAWAAQVDWFSTYHGGYGYWSWGPGLEDAADAGGRLLDHLEAAGVDPDVQIAVLYGINPLVAVDQPSMVVDPLGGDYGEVAGQDDAFWTELVETTLAPDFPDLELTADDLAGLRGGDLVLGEISGLSDGVLFAGSASATQTLLGRDAELLESRGVDLSHLDLLLASPGTGAMLVAQGEADPDLVHLRALGQRWIDGDSLGWIADILALGEDEPGDDDDSAVADDDDVQPDDDDSTVADDDDDDEVDDDDSAAPERDAPFTQGCGCRQAEAASGPWWLLLLLPAWLSRRR